jgi:hypothetical protein
MRAENGQATVEWVALVLVATLALGALAAVRAPEQDRGLGSVLAKRITCAAGGSCALAAIAPPAARRSALAPAPGTAPAPAVAPAPASAPPRAHPVPRAKAAEAFRRLRGAGKLTNRIWITCLGYRRYVYERDHLLEPYGTMPLDEALEIADTCLNPLNFLGDE